jgi:hypothetical protein
MNSNERIENLFSRDQFSKDGSFGSCCEWLDEHFIQSVIKKFGAAVTEKSKPADQSNFSPSEKLILNSFVWWSLHLSDLCILNLTGFENMIFHECYRSGIPGFDTILDVSLHRQHTPVFIKGVLLEPFRPEIREMPQDFLELHDCRADTRWFGVYKELLEDPALFTHLNAHDLIRTFFGLANPEYNIDPGILVYLYWEPENAENVPECIKHRIELSRFSERVEGDPSLGFLPLSYKELWVKWEQCHPSAKYYIGKLRRQYQISV